MACLFFGNLLLSLLLKALDLDAFAKSSVILSKKLTEARNFTRLDKGNLDKVQWWNWMSHWDVNHKEKMLISIWSFYHPEMIDNFGPWIYTENKSAINFGACCWITSAICQCEHMIIGGFRNLMSPEISLISGAFWINFGSSKSEFLSSNWHTIVPLGWGGVKDPFFQALDDPRTPPKKNRFADGISSSFSLMHYWH